MRQITFILILLSSLLFSTNAAHAGILVRKHTLSTQSTHQVSDERKATQIEKVAALFSGNQHECEKDGCDCNCHKKSTNMRCGSAGTTSMWLSILGWFYCPPLLIAGLAYGARGMRPDSCKKNRAKAGIVIGIAGVFFWTLILVAATMW